MNIIIFKAVKNRSKLHGCVIVIKIVSMPDWQFFPMFSAKALTVSVCLSVTYCVCDFLFYRYPFMTKENSML